MNMRFVRTWAMLALVMVIGMSVTGGTIAWFTDSVTSANNVIQAGNLDVDVTYIDATGVEKSINQVNELFADVTRWEPGAVAWENLTVVNEGDLALKYQLVMNSTNENTVNGYGLSSALKVGFVDGAIAADATRESVKSQVSTWHTFSSFNAAGQLYPNGSTAGASSKPYGVVVYWEPTAEDNNWNVNNGKTTSDGKDHLSIDLGIKVLATQLAAEEDSFDATYDKDAWHPEMIVSSASDLQAALSTGGNIQLSSNVELTKDEQLVIPAGVKVVLNLNGKTLSGTAIKQQHVLVNNGTLVVEGGTIKSSGDDGGSAISNNGTLTAKNVTLKGAPFVGLDGWWPSYAVNNSGTMTLTDSVITAEHGGVASTGGGIVTLNNVTITAGKDGKTNAAVYTNGGKVVINGGTYTNRATDQNTTGASVINGAVTVNAGTFNGRIENYSGTPVIKGGTFSVEPKASFVASGYKVTDNGDGTFTVGGYEVSTGDELVAAIANGKAVELTQNVNLDKIDLTDAITNDVVINANGHKITTADAYGIEVTSGKNVTISNANVEMTKEGDYNTYAAGFKIANGDYAGATITLKDCTITMANTDWAYAVNMPASVKNLNLVIDNCKLEGAIAVQCWGDNNTITITDSELICNYTTNALYTSYCVVLQDDSYNKAENNTLVIDNCKFTYSGVDNFNSEIHAVSDLGTGNTVTVTNCTYGEKVVAE